MNTLRFSKQVQTGNRTRVLIFESDKSEQAGVITKVNGFEWKLTLHSVRVKRGFRNLEAAQVMAQSLNNV